MIVAGFLLEIIALVGLILLRDPVALFGCRILSAIAFNTVVITAVSRMHDTVNNKNRSKKSGLFNSILSVATMVAPLIGGLIADHYGYTNLFIFTLIIASFILSAIVIIDYFFFKEKRVLKKNTAKICWQDINPFNDIKEAMRHSQIKALSFIGIAANFSAPFTVLIMPYLIIEKMGLTNTHLSIVLVIMGIAHITQFFWGIVADRIGKNRGIIIGILISSFSLIGMFFVKTYIALLALILIRSLGGSLWNVSAGAYLSDRAESMHIEGKVMGSYVSLSRFSTTISFIISGYFISSINEGIFLVYGGLVLLAVLLFGRILFKRPIIQSEKICDA